MPCLNTKVFWAPIATISEIPRKKPVKKDDINLRCSFLAIFEENTYFPYTVYK